MPTKDLKEVLDELDQKDDANWTAEGLPTLDAVSKKTGHNVTRKEINEASPGFVRATDAKGEKFERKVAAVPRNSGVNEAVMANGAKITNIDGVPVVTEAPSSPMAPPPPVVGNDKMRGNAIDGHTGNPVIVDTMLYMDHPTGVLSQPPDPERAAQIEQEHASAVEGAQKAVAEANKKLAEVLAAKDKDIMANELYITNESVEERNVRSQQEIRKFQEASTQERAQTAGQPAPLRGAPIDEAMASKGTVRPSR